MLPKVPELADQYAGAKKEKALFAALVHKYGPEPEGEPHEGPDLPHEHPAGILTADRPGGTKHSRPKASGSRQQPKPRVLRINLLTLDATRAHGLTLDYARESLQPIHSALEPSRQESRRDPGAVPGLNPRTQDPEPTTRVWDPESTTRFLVLGCQAGAARGRPKQW